MNHSTIQIRDRNDALPEGDKHGFLARALLTFGLILGGVAFVLLFLMMCIVF